MRDFVTQHEKIDLMNWRIVYTVVDFILMSLLFVCRFPLLYFSYFTSPNLIYHHRTLLKRKQKAVWQRVCLIFQSAFL